jgi:undecaprenyl diphosphate synthase
MDGNGRWAQARSLLRVEGHVQGAAAAEKLALDCAHMGFDSLVLYSFSIENWKRPPEEVTALMHLYEEYLIRMRPMLMRENVRFVHLGRRQGLPEAVLNELDRTLSETSDNSGMMLAMALNYGARSEIVDATRAIAESVRLGQLEPEQIDEACIRKYLYTAEMEDPDLVIRTSNEMRISNFLLWQISYSEFYVTPTHWPDFDRAQLELAIQAYAARDRRFGALSKEV